MTITPEQRQAFEEAARPMIQWLNEHANPHHKVIVTPVGAELVSGELAMRDESFLRG